MSNLSTVDTHRVIGTGAVTTSVRAHDSLAKRRADAILTVNYAPKKRRVIGAMRSHLQNRGCHLDELDLEASYNVAWYVAHCKLAQGEPIAKLEPFLCAVGRYKALDEVRRRSVLHRAGLASAATWRPQRHVATDLNTRTLLRCYIEALQEILTDRERKAIVLCQFHGFTRPEVAKAIGVSEKRIQQIMDAAQVKLRPHKAAIRRGEWCARYMSRLMALSFGVLDHDGDLFRCMTDHLAHCSACRQELRELRGKTQRQCNRVASSSSRRES